MPWLWDQSEGKLYSDTKSNLVSKGYSGKGRGKNNPALQNMRGVGPVPRGTYEMTSVYNSRRVGPFTITLTPVDGDSDDTHDETGRGAFRIHGDSIRNPGSASKGCIILPRSIRQRMWRAKDKILVVLE